MPKAHNRDSLIPESRPCTEVLLFEASPVVYGDLIQNLAGRVLLVSG